MALESAIALAADHRTVLLVPASGPLTALAPRQVRTKAFPFGVLRKSDASTTAGRALQFVRVSTVGVVRAYLELRRLRPAAVHVNTVICPQWIVAAHLLGLPVITHVHEIEQRMNRTVQKVLLMWPALSDVLIANSRATAAWMIDVCPRLEGRVTVVPNGVERPSSQAFTHAIPNRSAGHIAVVVGRLSERKGQHVAVRAFGLVVGRFPDAHLVLVGEEFGGEGAYTARLRHEVADLGLEDHVDFVGETEDPWVFYDAADVVVVPSLQEPFGNVAVEAGLAGKPVVASAVEGLIEIVEPDVTGILVPASDEKLLASALVDLFNDSERAAALGSSARKRMAQRFDLATYHVAVRETWARLIERASHS